jgi:hypothetical protein
MIVRVRREVPDQQRDHRHHRGGGHRNYLPHLQSP